MIRGSILPLVIYYECDNYCIKNTRMRTSLLKFKFNRLRQNITWPRNVVARIGALKGFDFHINIYIVANLSKISSLNFVTESRKVTVG